MPDDYVLYDYEKVCGDKIPHDDRDQAIRQAEEVRQHNKDNRYLKTYICPFCEKWHIGHVPQKKKKSRRKHH